jgi:hypothetical protein
VHGSVPPFEARSRTTATRLGAFWGPLLYRRSGGAPPSTSLHDYQAQILVTRARNATPAVGDAAAEAALRSTLVGVAFRSPTEIWR